MIRAAASSRLIYSCYGMPLPAGRSIPELTKCLLHQSNRSSRFIHSVTNTSVQRRKGYRFLSSAGNNKPNKDGGNINGGGEETQIVLTPGEKVAAASRLTMYLGLAGFAAVCAFYIGKELIPTKMSPNTVFSNALEKIQDHPEVSRRFGSPVKGYGRDHGGKREGRRNFIEHTEYKSEEDGSNRTRVRFNLEGPNGKAFCFAEVSDQMPSGEFVYILVQDKLNGNVIEIIDNRATIALARMTGGDKEGEKIFNQLLTGGSSSSNN